MSHFFHLYPITVKLPIWNLYHLKNRKRKKIETEDDNTFFSGSISNILNPSSEKVLIKFTQFFVIWSTLYP